MYKNDEDGSSIDEKMPTRGWLQSFLQHHEGRLVYKKSKPLDSLRIKGTNSETLRVYLFWFGEPDQRGIISF